MSRIGIFTITGMCSFEECNIDNSPCVNYPDVDINCLLDNCPYFVLYDTILTDEDLLEN